MVQLPQFPNSYWRASTPMREFPKLQENKTTEVCVVGGGITGITTAYMLAKKGKEVILVDADRLFNNTTGHTTAKITAQHGLIYDEFIHLFGIETAKIYYEAQVQALDFIKNTITEHQIDCDFTQQDAYIFTDSNTEIPKIKNEFKAYQALGIEGAFVEEMSLPFSVKAAVKMNNQAQFHPLKYLASLVDQFIRIGGQIYELTPVVKIKDDGKHPVVVTEVEFLIDCEQIVLASHFPIIDKLGFYFARMHAEKSYVVAIKTNQPFTGGMYINSEQPTRSIRMTNYQGEQLLLIGGENHRTGLDESTITHYQNLVDFANQHFAPTEIAYHWSTQDLITIDKLPFVGPVTEKKSHIFVASGYRKWGMTNATAAANLITDLIIRQENPYAQIVDPSRFHTNPSLKNLLSNTVEMTKELVGGKLEFYAKKPEDLSVNSGGVVSYHGKRAGAYRDENGQLHMIDTTCTHMGCELNWNSGDLTWDCPCHGSRFDVEGNIVEGPAKKPLKKLN